jgi:tRNA-modifying protein YgfZ
MQQRTPAYDAQAGAAFTEEAGWLLPAHFRDVDAEYRAVREGADTVFDLSHYGKIDVSGPDAASFLHNLSTNDVKGLKLDSHCEAFLTTGQAKIVAYVLIDRVRLPNGQELFTVDAGPGFGEKVATHLNRYLISEQVEISDHTHHFAQFHVAGINAADILERINPCGIVDFGALGSAAATQNVARYLFRRHDRMGAVGYDVICPQHVAGEIWKALTAAGAWPAGLETYHVLRIEAGTPVNGIDIDETNLPQEVGRIDQTISFTKGCYIGQETVARIRTYGHVNRALVGVKRVGPGELTRGDKLFRDGQEVGQITSAAQSPRVGAAIGLAYVRRGSQEPGTRLDVQAADGRTTVEVGSLPFTLSGAGTAG